MAKLEKSADSVTATIALEAASQETQEFEPRHRRRRHRRQCREPGPGGAGREVENRTSSSTISAAPASPGVYAIGDVAGPPWLAHKASHEGVVCVEQIAGERCPSAERDELPGCTYSHPQVASVGLTEAAAKAERPRGQGRPLPLQGNGKAIALGEPEGFVKTVFDAKTGELLGAHMIGAEVTELIQGFASPGRWRPPRPN